MYSLNALKYVIYLYTAHKYIGVCMWLTDFAFRFIDEMRISEGESWLVNERTHKFSSHKNWTERLRENCLVMMRAQEVQIGRPMTGASESEREIQLLDRWEGTGGWD